jgi:CHASE3 domain sensor protein
MKTLTIFQRNPLVMGLALAAAAAVVFISEASYWRSAGTLQELSAMGAARTQIQVLERSMLDAETGQRGYLLTQRKEYLEPYAQALLRVEEAYRVLDTYYGRSCCSACTA